jgi:hypothetical protein
MLALPLRFEPNRGQLADGVAFEARGASARVALSPQGATLTVLRRNGAGRPANIEGAVIAMRVVGARTVAPQPSERLEGHANYLVGADRSKWRTGIEGYARVTYAAIRPGIDLTFYGNSQRELEYDLVVAPGVDPAGLAMAFDGADAVELTPGGEVVLTGGGGEIHQRAPSAYQRGAGGARTAVDVRYTRREDGTVGFVVGAFDPTRPLIIDPTLAYSTYIGGSNDADYVTAVAVDAFGNTYLTGSAGSTNFPTTPGAFQPTSPGGSYSHVFVTKLNVNGASYVYSTYLGGNNEDDSNAIAVDSQGDAYVVGDTFSTNFPTHAAYQSALVGGGGTSDVFVTKLDPGGDALVYSTFLGGSQGDVAFGVAVDASGSAYLTGLTQSTNFPTLSAYQASYAGPANGSDAFATKFSATGALVYSTYLGAGTDQANAVAVDSAGSAYVAGQTSSAGFPTLSAYQSTLRGTKNAFITKLGSNGASLVYSTYLGGSASDTAAGIAVDTAGSAYVTGTACSTNFPVVSAYQATIGGGCDAFVTKLAPNGQSLVYSTYLGGSAAESGTGIGLDPGRSVYLAGSTSSTNFPLFAAVQLSPGGGGDAYATKLDPSGQHIVYSTYLGGSFSDSPLGTLAVGWERSTYLGGITQSQNFPTVSAVIASPPAPTIHGFASRISTPIFASLGCYSDNPGGRDLNGASLTTATNTPSQCIAYCEGLGFPYAAVEFGSQCFCGNTYGSYGTSSGCTQTCPGDATQNCGGFGAEVVYQTAYYGCFFDNAGGRDLSGSSQTTATNTPGTCIAFCNGKGYRFAAVEFGDQCFCGSSYGMYEPSAGCTQACPGNSSQICGGSDAESVYETSFLGCFGDTAGSRDLSGLSQTMSSNTPASCIAFCKANGYPYAAVEFSDQCFCGTSYGKYGVSTGCTQPCSGDGAQVCGGGDAESVYTTAGPPPPVTPTPAIPALGFAALAAALGVTGWRRMRQVRRG